MRKLLLFCSLLVLLASGAYAQSGTVTGTVNDPQGLPLPGATVQIAGDKQATITNVNGKFSIQASVGQTLHTTFVGYQPVDIKLSAITVFLVVSFFFGVSVLFVVVVFG